jgi:hypothetical protein
MKRRTTARKKKRGNRVKLCREGREILVMSDLPASISGRDSTKRASTFDYREHDESPISLAGIEIPTHLGEINLRHAKAAWGGKPTSN